MAVEGASSPEDAAAYPVMAQYMTDVGGDLFWKSYRTVTDDGYVLTLFRIEADSKGKPIKQ